jgi:hypothetical protein
MNFNIFRLGKKKAIEQTDTRVKAKTELDLLEEGIEKKLGNLRYEIEVAIDNFLVRKAQMGKYATIYNKASKINCNITDWERQKLISIEGDSDLLLAYFRLRNRWIAEFEHCLGSLLDEDLYWQLHLTFETIYARLIAERVYLSAYPKVKKFPKEWDAGYSTLFSCIDGHFPRAYQEKIAHFYTMLCDKLIALNKGVNN